MKAVLSSENRNTRETEIAVTGSKSESNRLLILQALYPNLSIENLSESDDTVLLSKGLKIQNGIVDIHHAGTAMRFLTAYFAGKEGVEIVLTGSARMQERPIGVLVDALRSLGASIEYENEEGYPPLKISGKNLSEERVSVAANISSQYISALMLLAPSLSNGLNIMLEGKVTSVPYITMTLALLERLGIHGSFLKNEISIPSAENIKDISIVVESDWSSASYFYSIAALSENIKIRLTSYRKDSLQGDAALSRIYETLGVKTEFLEEENAIVLSKFDLEINNEIYFDLANTPDIAQTIAVCSFGLGKGCVLTGLHTLKIKETDRLTALKVELEKLGARVNISRDSLHLYPSNEMRAHVAIDTYHDHRMAMAFAPLGLLVPITIKDSGVVSKSFPSFWKDMKTVGISVDFIS
ncbi:MAG: 3-phosphoshikimate 1-carboxyvinyltransferase [Bacteroidota bacterium]